MFKVKLLRHNVSRSSQHNCFSGWTIPKALAEANAATGLLNGNGFGRAFTLGWGLDWVTQMRIPDRSLWRFKEGPEGDLRGFAR